MKLNRGRGKTLKGVCIVIFDLKIRKFGVFLYVLEIINFFRNKNKACYF